MGSSAIPDSAKEHSLTDHRLDAIDRRFDAIDQRFDALDSKIDTQAILLARLDTKMNIIMGMLGVAGAGASFLLIRLLLG